ncbi:hypothetical protein HDU93_007967 [Gonapodya sp. JEL0774]|nr:hypothetical protein HDU93_007967 [Gonapodya sp. JEL0774]
MPTLFSSTSQSEIEPYKSPFAEEGFDLENPFKRSLTLERHKGIVETARWKVKDRLAQKEGTHGMVFFTNGDRYLGEWHADKKHGNGIQVTAKDGSVYEGGWIEGQRSGYGTLSVPTQSLGGFRETNPSSPKSKDAAQMFKLSTKATTELFNQLSTAPALRPVIKPRPHTDSNTPAPQPVPLTKIYAGYWAHDQRNGQGTFFYPDGARYEGEWRDDMQHGWGTMSYVNGDRFEATTSNIYSGTFMDDLKEGPGRYIYRSQRRCYEGEWSRNQPVCGNITDLPGLDGSTDGGKIPKIFLRDVEAVLASQREELTNERLARMAGSKSVAENLHIPKRIRPLMSDMDAKPNQWKELIENEKKRTSNKYRFPGWFRKLRDTFVTPYVGEEYVKKLGIGDVRYLTGADSLFLYFDNPWWSMTVSGIYMFEKKIPPDLVKAQIAGYCRRHGAAVISKIVRNDDGPFLLRRFGRPYFEIDEEFDIERHFQVVKIAEPGDDRALQQACSKLISESWDYSRPLWKAVYLEGLREDGREKCALWWPAHHAAGDGQGFIRALLSYVATLDPVTGLPPPIANPDEEVDLSALQYQAGNLFNSQHAKHTNGKVDTSAELESLKRKANGNFSGSLATNGISNGVSAHVNGHSILSNGGSHADGDKGRTPKNLYKKYALPLITLAMTILFAFYGVLTGLLFALWNTILLIIYARRRSMWNPRGFVVEKQISYSKKIPLKDVKFAKDTLKCTVNDLLLTAVNVGLSNYLMEGGNLLDDNFTYLVPASLRSPTDLSLSNQSSGWYVTLPSKTRKGSEGFVVDPVDMLKVVQVSFFI